MACHNYYLFGWKLGHLEEPIQPISKKILLTVIWMWNIRNDLICSGNLIKHRTRYSTACSCAPYCEGKLSRPVAHVWPCNLQFKKPKFIPVIFLKNSETSVLTIMRLTLPSISPMIEKGIRGGISVIWNNFGGAINLYMGEAYDVTKLTKYITYLDTNNVYGWAMCQNVPASSCQRFQVDDYLRQLEKYSLHSCGRSWKSKRASWLA